jgi:hypothetical protein
VVAPEDARGTAKLDSVNDENAKRVVNRVTRVIISGIPQYYRTLGIKSCGNYSANSVAITLAPIKGRKKAPPTRGWQEKGPTKITSFSDEIAAKILKSGE